jgi:hypothetical protein
MMDRATCVEADASECVGPLDRLGRHERRAGDDLVPGQHLHCTRRTGNETWRGATTRSTSGRSTRTTRSAGAAATSRTSGRP